MASSALSRVFPSLLNVSTHPVNYTSICRLPNFLPGYASLQNSATVFSDRSPRRGPLTLSVGLHTSACLLKGKTPAEALDGPRKWPAYNTIVLPPQEPTEPRRPAQCFHYRTQMRHSDMKLWYAAQMIRGMSIDDALTQLTFNNKKAAHLIKEVLLEAQELAVKEHNFEFKSKMYIAESFATRGIPVKGYRKHGKGRFGVVTYNFNHYFVKLEEGDPPKDYWPPKIKPIKEQAEDHIEGLRSRRVFQGL